MKLVYPACFYLDKKTGDYAVEVPDLPGCVSGGSSLAEAVDMATDAASGWVLTELEDGKPVPKASGIKDIIPESSGFVSMLVLDMAAYAEKYGNKAVRKNLTIPAWLNTFAEDNNINFSKVLQESLIGLYQKKNA
ncbi:MAG: type II toxin-antitoxin system HicB family antitoxin [Candidatus Riflebacteria bacterium]|nr:type II toxin-antitoxin system HicB family antitoxin [Candidatus Riflebacteria bacterium]